MSKKRPEIPTYSHPIIETHFHLDMLKTHSPEEILSMSKQHHITSLITISTGKDNLDQIIEYTQEFENVFCSQGCHPHDSCHWDATALAHLKTNLNNPTKNAKIVAIGETGLDYYYLKSSREEQLRVFEEHLQVASDFKLPLVIHTRDADEDTIEILKKFSKHLPHKGVLHSFTSGQKLAEYALSEGFYLGFNGIITFKNAQNVRDILALTPMNRILLETDAPFLTPDPYRGNENAPHYLPFIAAKIAEVKNHSLEEVLPIIFENTLRLFSKLPK